MMALRERELLTGFSCDMYAFPYIQKFRVVKLLVKDGKKARIKKKVPLRDLNPLTSPMQCSVSWVVVKLSIVR